MTKTVFTIPYKTLIDLLIAERKKAGLTQRELASRVRKPQSHISKYENGERRLDVVELIQIAGALHIDLLPIIRKVQDAMNDEAAMPQIDNQ